MAKYLNNKIAIWSHWAAQQKEINDIRQTIQLQTWSTDRTSQPSRSLRHDPRRADQWPLQRFLPERRRRRRLQLAPLQRIRRHPETKY